MMLKFSAANTVHKVLCCLRFFVSNEDVIDPPMFATCVVMICVAIEPYDEYYLLQVHIPLRAIESACSRDQAFSVTGVETAQ